MVIDAPSARPSIAPGRSAIDSAIRPSRGASDGSLAIQRARAVRSIAAASPGWRVETGVPAGASPSAARSGEQVPPLMPEPSVEFTSAPVDPRPNVFVPWMNAFT